MHRSVSNCCPLEYVHACPDKRLAYSINALQVNSTRINKPLTHIPCKRAETRQGLTEQDDPSCPFLGMGEIGRTAMRSHTSALRLKPNRHVPPSRLQYRDVPIGRQAVLRLPLARSRRGTL